jgi:hypothetical protein
VGALLAASMTAWLHQLTGLAAGEDMLAGAGGRGGKAMIATLRRRLIAVLGRLTRHARHLVLRIPPGTTCCPRCQPGCESCPHPADLRTRALRSPPSATARQPDSQEGLRTANPARSARPRPGIPSHQGHLPRPDSATALFADSGLT